MVLLVNNHYGRGGFSCPMDDA